MPTPVSAARQCLTTEAAQALDEAVSVARRRGHAQTTSLHAVSALLSSSSTSSSLREACARARSSAYSPRLQLKALDLSLAVSLDRLSSAATSSSSEPPVSNSLMAAIKRSQANQRRQPENYHLYHHHHSSQSAAMVCVRVELQHLTLSILDDPVVSRVFGEAGFRSSDIKMAILRPFSQLLRYRGPPVFLCNLQQAECPTIPSSRIGEILGRIKGRNPVLIGACANDALRSFVDSVADAVLPPGLAGLSVVSVDSRRLLGEIGGVIERCSGAGIVMSFGELGEFFSGDKAGEAVAEVTRVLEVYGGKVWVIGATVSYESYLKLLNEFPSVEKDWDLQLLPITSLRSSSSSSMAESYPRSSLMESFVPFGGFFSAPSDLKFPLNRPIQCHVSHPGSAEKFPPSLPSWLQTQTTANKPLKTVVGFRSLSDAVSVDLNSSIPTVEESDHSSSCNSVTTDLGLGPIVTDAKAIFRALAENATWQLDAARNVSEAILRRRARSGASRRGDTWLCFLGPDRRGMRRIALALAEILYGKRESSMICVDLSSRNGTAIRSESGEFFRGKNVVDYIAGEIGKRPLSVAFLENVDESDLLVRRSLARAVSTGKLSDSHGREVGTSNTTFVVTSATSSPNNLGTGFYTEERVSKAAKNSPMRIAIESPKVSKNPILMNKRKSVSLSEITTIRPRLDLNLPAESEEEEEEGEEEETESHKSWFRDFREKLDETVVFKPADLDAVAEKISGLVTDCFEGSFGPGTASLEIDPKAMERMIAAAYFSDEHRVVEDWVERVLRKGFEEARERHSESLNPRSVVKLVACCEGLISSEDQSRNCYLPPRIIL